jgi:TonB family protein
LRQHSLKRGWPAVAVLLVWALAFGLGADASVVETRKAFVQEVGKDVARVGVKKVYVPDFTGSGGGETALGRFFAATFAQMLGKSGEGIVVVKRADAHRSLHKSGRTDRDLATGEVLAKFVSDFGADGILWGTVSVNQDLVTTDVVMRDPSGKELFRRRYEEKLDGELRADYEAGQSGSDFYYAGLDGVSPPRCLYCPIPGPAGRGSARREGDVVLSILVTVQGKADQMSVVQSLDPAYDRAVVDEVRMWRFEPAEDAEGKLVPVRVPVQITFKTSR